MQDFVSQQVNPQPIQKNSGRDAKLVGHHTPGMQPQGIRILIVGDIHAHYHSTTLATGSCRTIVHRLSVLTECKGLGPAKFCTLLFDASESTFAGISVYLRSHLNIILWETSEPVVCEKRAVATVQNVHFRIRQFWVSMSIRSTVFVPDKFSPDINISTNSADQWEKYIHYRSSMC